MQALTPVQSVSAIPVEPEALLVAFASQEGDIVDQHFGSAQAFFLYAITADTAELVGHQGFGYEKKDGNEDKLKPKMTWLVGTDVVYCGSIGGSATRQLISLGINPVQVTGGPDVEEVITDLQKQLQGEPEPWLVNILKRKQKNKQDDRFAAMADEDWSE